MSVRVREGSRGWDGPSLLGGYNHVSHQDWAEFHLGTQTQLIAGILQHSPKLNNFKLRGKLDNCMSE